MPPMGGEPQRTCIACRKTAAAAHLLRFVLDPGNCLLLDLSRTLPGRGSHVCARRECLAKALEKNLFARAFRRTPLPVEPSEIMSQVASSINRRLLSLVSLANRSGAVVSGSDQVESALRNSSDALFLLVTQDTSPDRRSRFMGIAAARTIPVIVGFRSDEVGAVLGKASRNVVLFRRNGLTVRLHEELDAYMEFNGIKGVQES